MSLVPPYLKKGDTIGIVCPAGYMPLEKAQTCIQTLQSWGYKVQTGATLGNRFNYFSGTDEQRLTDLQQMLDDENVKAVLCGRGGYGLSRIIDELDFKGFKKNPKWIIGYSDITVLHSHLLAKFNTASLHAPMAAAFNDGGAENEFIQSLRKAISGSRINYSCTGHPLNRGGEATGGLTGGNLTMLIHLLGSVSEVNNKGKILFIEDVGEYIYNIDRMMLQLKRAGRLQHLAGLIVGSFSDLKDTTLPFGQAVYEAIFDKVKAYNYPVCFDFPVGHNDKNLALKTGLNYQLKVSKNKVVLKEMINPGNPA